MCSATLFPAPDRPLSMISRIEVRPRRRPPRPSDARALLCLGGVVIGNLFLVLAHTPVELVGERIDRRVHVGVFGQCMDRLTAQMQCRLGPLLELFHRQHAVRIDHVIGMAHQALELLFHVAAQRGTDLDMMAGDAQMHGLLLSRETLFCRHRCIHCGCSRRRSLEGASPMDSRYFATVRRATGMPSADSSSAMRLSLRGLRAASSRISFLILARIAVEEVPAPPPAPSTWLEKK